MKKMMVTAVMAAAFFGVSAAHAQEAKKTEKVTVTKKKMVPDAKEPVKLKAAQTQVADAKQTEKVKKGAKVKPVANAQKEKAAVKK